MRGPEAPLARKNGVVFVSSCHNKQDNNTISGKITRIKGPEEGLLGALISPVILQNQPIMAVNMRVRGRDQEK